MFVYFRSCLLNREKNSHKVIRVFSRDKKNIVDRKNARLFSRERDQKLMTNVGAIGKNERQFVCILSTESCVNRKVFDCKAVCPRDTPRRNFVVRERGIFCDFHLRREEEGCEIDGSAKREGR